MWRTFRRSRNGFAPHSVLREFLKDAIQVSMSFRETRPSKGVARTLPGRNEAFRGRTGADLSS